MVAEIHEVVLDGRHGQERRLAAEHERRDDVYVVGEQAHYDLVRESVVVVDEPDPLGIICRQHSLDSLVARTRDVTADQAGDRGSLGEGELHPEHVHPERRVAGEVSGDDRDGAGAELDRLVEQRRLRLVKPH